MTPENRTEEFYDLREQVARLEEKLIARDKALELASQILESWKSTSNEWRAALSDNNSRFITGDEVKALLSKEEIKREALATIVASIDKNRSEVAGKSMGFSSMWAIIVSVLFLVISIISLVAARWPK